MHSNDVKPRTSATVILLFYYFTFLKFKIFFFWKVGRGRGARGGRGNGRGGGRIGARSGALRSQVCPSWFFKKTLMKFNFFFTKSKTTMSNAVSVVDNKAVVNKRKVYYFLFLQLFIFNLLTFSFFFKKNSTYKRNRS